MLLYYEESCVPGDLIHINAFTSLNLSEGHFRLRKPSMHLAQCHRAASFRGQVWCGLVWILRPCFCFNELIVLNWRIITLRYGDGCLPNINMILAIGIHVIPHSWSPLPSPSSPYPSRLSWAPALGALLHASNLHLSSVLHMVTCMLQR